MVLKLQIVTAERMVLEDDVDMVVAPGIDGHVGILPKHAPMVTLLDVGELRIKKGTEEISMAVSGGFLEVLHDRVMILADTAERAEEIDEARAEAARRRAQQLLAENRPEADLLEAQAALRRASIRLKVARRRRVREGAPPGSGA
jgi:F-type H+-transporting ATPase subunit epsilon